MRRCNILNFISLFCLLFSLSRVYLAFVKRTIIQLSLDPRIVRGTCDKSHHVRARGLVRVFWRNRERERGGGIRKKGRWKGMTAGEKARAREKRPGNVSNSGDVNARESVTRALRFVYFSWKALARSTWRLPRLRVTRVCIQRAALSPLRLLSPRSPPFSSRRSLIHGG